MPGEGTGGSYPDGQQTEVGRILIIFDYDQTGERHILMAAFREEDALAGEAKSDEARLRHLVPDASGGMGK